MRYNPEFIESCENNTKLMVKAVFTVMKKISQGKEEPVINNTYSRYFTSKYFIGIIWIYCFGYLLLIKPFGMNHLYGWRLLLNVFVFELAIIATTYLMLEIYNISVPYDKIGVPFLAVAMILSCSLSVYLLGLIDYFVSEKFISILKDCTFIAILPSALTWLLFDKIFYSTYHKKAARVNEDFKTSHQSDEHYKTNKLFEKEDKITLIGKNLDNKLEFNASDLIYIKAEENYCLISFKKNETMHREYFRSSLSALYEQAKGASRNIIRCHRTYIVNLDHVLEMHGNSRGYHLQLKYDNAEIPVSRNFPDVFLLKKRFGCKNMK